MYKLREGLCEQRREHINNDISQKRNQYDRRGQLAQRRMHRYLAFRPLCLCFVYRMFTPIRTTARSQTRMDLYTHFSPEATPAASRRERDSQSCPLPTHSSAASRPNRASSHAVSILGTADSLRRLAGIVAVGALELLDEGDVALLGIGLRRFGVDLLLPRLLLGFALYFRVVWLVSM